MKNSDLETCINIEEKELRTLPGILMLIVNIAGSIASILLLILAAANGSVLMMAAGIIFVIVFPILFAGLKIVNPNEALVLTLFGKYTAQ